MNEELQNILDNCIDHILTRGESIEDCLRRYPQHAAELEPLLRLATSTRSALDYSPSSASKEAAKRRFQQAAARLERRWQQRRSPFRWLLPLPRAWAIPLGALMMMLVLGTGTVAASTNQMPDQPLYPVKRFTETVRLTFTFNPQSKASLHARLADRRLKEMSHLIQKGKEEKAQAVLDDFHLHMSRVISLAGAEEESLPLEPVEPGPGEQEAVVSPVVEVTPTATPPTSQPESQEVEVVVTEELQPETPTATPVPARDAKRKPEVVQVVEERGPQLTPVEKPKTFTATPTPTQEVEEEQQKVQVAQEQRPRHTPVEKPKTPTATLIPARDAKRKPEVVQVVQEQRPKPTPTERQKTPTATPTLTRQVEREQKDVQVVQEQRLQPTAVERPEIVPTREVERPVPDEIKRQQQECFEQLERTKKDRDKLRLLLQRHYRENRESIIKAMEGASEHTKAALRMQLRAIEREYEHTLASLKIEDHRGECDVEDLEEAEEERHREQEDEEEIGRPPVSLADTTGSHGPYDKPSSVIAEYEPAKGYRGR